MESPLILSHLEFKQALPIRCVIARSEIPRFTRNKLRNPQEFFFADIATPSACNDKEGN
jgi:hypothetical protein